MSRDDQGLSNYQTTQLPNFLPRLLHLQGILFHDGTLAQDSPPAAELFQRLEERLQIQVRFSQRQVILLALRSILDARKVDMQFRQSLRAENVCVSLQEA